MPDPDRTARARRATLGALTVLALAILVAVRVSADDGVPDAVPQNAAEGPATPGSTVVAPVTRAPSGVPDGVLGGLRFVDVTHRAGLSAPDPRRPSHASDMDAGVAVVDLDDDGDHELLLTSAGAASGLYRNDAGTFTDITGRSRLAGLERATVAAFADVDGDRDLDAFVGGPQSAFGRLWVNDGRGRFSDRSTAAGVVPPSEAAAARRTVRGADFGDVDLDGDLDLLVTDWNPDAVVAAAVSGAGVGAFESQCEYAAFMRRQLERGEVPPTGQTRLFLNDGGGSFTDRTQSWGLTGLGATLALTPQFHDLDGDGRLDLAIAGDVCTSRVLRNAGDRFVDHTAASGAGTAENGMGSLIHDLDGDGRPDWMVTSIGYPTADGSCPQVSLFAGCSGNRVFVNQGRMRFRDVTDDLGLRHGWWAWGVAAGDFANDGRSQIAVTNGVHPLRGDLDPESQRDVYYDAFRADPTQLWVAQEGGVFTDVAVQAGLEHDGVGFGLVAFDYDLDGRLDLLITHAGSAPALFRNVSPARHWLTVRLEDPGSPGDARGLGARVEVTTAAGDASVHWVHVSGSYQTQRPAEVHVGLGRDRRPVRVRVWWPGGSAPQVVRRQQVDRVAVIRRSP